MFFLYSALEAESLPESIELLEGLIEDHKDLMEHTQKRQNEVDRVCKAYQVQYILLQLYHGVIDSCFIHHLFRLRKIIFGE